MVNQEQGIFFRPEHSSLISLHRIIDSTRVQFVTTVLELFQIFLKFDSSGCALKGFLADKFGWEELRQFVLYAPLLSEALNRHVASNREQTFRKPASFDGLKVLWYVLLSLKNAFY